MGPDYMQHARWLATQVREQKMTKEEAVHHIQQYTETYNKTRATVFLHDALIQQARMGKGPQAD